MKIQDGTGSGFEAGVTDSHRLLVDADSHDAILTASVDGKAFRFCAGLITLTSANPSAVLFIQNNEPSNLIVAEIVVRMNASTGGAGGVGLWEILRNPTTGTIISNASAATVVANANFGSTATISATAYKGAEGNTFTNGTQFAIVNGVTVPNRVNLVAAEGIILPRGASIGFRYTPPAGNTSIVVGIGVGTYLNSKFFSSNP